MTKKKVTDQLHSKSVTVGDQGKVSPNGGVMRVVLPWSMYGYDQFTLPPKPPAFWSPERDITLRSTPHQEAMWAGAVGIAVTKMASLSWQINAGTQAKKDYLRDMLLQADGRQVGWVQFVGKHLRDYLTTDNGAFTEIVREGENADDKIIGLRHLDSIRCVRTGDAEYPVIFRDKWGRRHVLKAHQVFGIVDMPDPGETYWGVGMCAASRAYTAIYKLAAIEWYLREKVAGLHPLAIHIVNGVLDTQLQNAVTAARDEQVSRGVAQYMGAVIVGVPSQTPPEVVTIPLAELPDRFNRKEEFDLSVLTYANSIGLDVQELQPLSGQALGTGTQSTILHDKGAGKGLISWKMDFTHALNECVFKEFNATFSFQERDWRDLKQGAEVAKLHSEIAEKRIAAGVTTPEQEREIMVELEDLPEEVLPADDEAEAPVTDEADVEGAENIEGAETEATPATPAAAAKPGRVTIAQALAQAVKKRTKTTKEKEVTTPPSEEKLAEAGELLAAEHDAARAMIERKEVEVA